MVREDLYYFVIEFADQLKLKYFFYLICILLGVHDVLCKILKVKLLIVGVVEVIYCIQSHYRHFFLIAFLHEFESFNFILE